MVIFTELYQFLWSSISNCALNSEVVNRLFPSGRPFEVETPYWDYKEKLPILPPHASDDQKVVHRAEIADLIKDAVSFYNAYGGYIVFGVKDRGHERVIGCNDSLDCGDFNKRIEAAAGRNIECIFSSIELPLLAGPAKLGVLFVPRRPDGSEPAIFKRAAPLNQSGKRAYQANDVYVRIRDESRPATATSSDWLFLHGPRRPDGEGMKRTEKRPMRVFLPARDPDLVEFVGREGYLASLRGWLSDHRSPVRLLTGIGGLGKTSIAYRFAEEVVDTRAGEIEQLVWLTAKARTFSALRGSIVESSRVDFSNARTLYRVILSHLGYEPDWEDDEPTNIELVEAIVEALSTYRCLVIVDDVDSLSADDQREVVYTLSSAAIRTVSGDVVPSRLLFTSRIDQGVAPANAIKIEGFERDEFATYINGVAYRFKVSLPPQVSFEQFYTATSGSPLFGASVLRLVRLGTSLPDALDRWRGEEGVEVRRFAFERELRQLPDAAARLLYAICLLDETTNLELSQILELSPTSIASSVASLQSFHLVVTQLNSKATATIKAPDDVALTRDVLEKHLGSGAGQVQSSCASARTRTENSKKKIASRIGQTIALWKAGLPSESLLEAERLSKEFPSNGDVTCLLATALTRVSPPDGRMVTLSLP